MTRAIFNCFGTMPEVMDNVNYMHVRCEIIISIDSLIKCRNVVITYSRTWTTVQISIISCSFAASRNANEKEPI